MGRITNILGSVVVLASLATTQLSANTIQVPLKDGSWTLVGVPGFHKYKAYGSTSGDPADLFYESTDTGVQSTAQAAEYAAGDKIRLTDDVNNRTANGTLQAPTWDRNITGGTSPVAKSTYTGSPYSVTSKHIDAGSPLYATLGVEVINGVTSGVSTASISWDYKVKDETSSMRVMYIKSPSPITPDVKITYQALYEGATFYMRFNGTTTTYSGTFSKDNTYDNPLSISLATLAGAAGSDGTTVSSIASLLDMDLSDNNTSGTILNFLNTADPATQTISSTDAANAGASTGALIGTRTPLDGNFTAFKWDAGTQQWRFFQLTNDASTLNSASDFTELEVGSAYWMYLDQTTPAGTSSTGAGGILLGDDGLSTDALKTAAYGTSVVKGWNMMSFDDERLRYSMTGLRLDGTFLSNDINLTDGSGAHTLQILSNSGQPAAGLNFARRWCMKINQAVEDNNSYGYTHFDVKCFAGDSNTSAYLIGTRKFTIQAGDSSVYSLTNETALTDDSNGSSGHFYTSQYGAYGLMIEPNPDWTFNGGQSSTGVLRSGGNTNGKINIVMPDINTTTTLTADFNRSAGYGAIADLGAVRKEMNTTIKTLAKGSTTATDVQDDSRAGSLDLDFDGIDDVIFLASKGRFYVRDNTFIRLFTYNSSTNAGGSSSLRIVGTASTTIGFDASTSNTKTVAGVSAFNEVNSTTDAQMIIIEHANNGTDQNDTVMAWCTTKSNFDIQENGTRDFLTDIASDTNESTKGPAEKVYYISAIAETVDTKNGEFHSDGNYSAATGSSSTAFTPAFSASVSNLKYNAIFAEDFPTDGPLYLFKSKLSSGGTYLRAENFVVADTQNVIGTDRPADFISWETIDVTRDPSTWYSTNNQYDIFWTEKEKGYWVYVDDGVANPVSITVGSSPVSGTVTRHFDNTINATTASGPVWNHFNKTLTVSAAGILGASDSTAVTTTNTTYEIYATIGGNTVPMFRSGAGTNFTLDLSDYETNGLVAGSTYDVTIVAADGLGNRNTASVSVDYTRPTLPVITATATAGVFSVTSTGANYFQFHENNISDITPDVSRALYTSDATDKALIQAGTYTISLASVSTSTFPTTAPATTTALTTAQLISAGYLADIRVIAVDGDVPDAATRVDTNSLYSDMAQTAFAPATKGAHVLTALVANIGDGNSTNDYDAQPEVFDSTGASQGLYSEPSSGVQIKAHSGGSDISISYAPIVGASLDQSNVSQLTISGLVTIIWNPQYDGKPFYLSFGGKMYAGFFSTTIDTLTEITDMSGATAQTFSKTPGL